MTHERFPHFLHDTGFHEPRVERVPKIMESENLIPARRIAAFQPVFSLWMGWPLNVKISPSFWSVIESRSKSRLVRGISRASPSGVFDFVT
jgi:hypothetical protein